MTTPTTTTCVAATAAQRRKRRRELYPISREATALGIDVEAIRQPPTFDVPVKFIHQRLHITQMPLDLCVLISQYIGNSHLDFLPRMDEYLASRDWCKTRVETMRVKKKRIALTTPRPTTFADLLPYMQWLFMSCGGDPTPWVRYLESTRGWIGCGYHGRASVIACNECVNNRVTFAYMVDEFMKLTRYVVDTANRLAIHGVSVTYIDAFLKYMGYTRFEPSSHLSRFVDRAFMEYFYDKPVMYHIGNCYSFVNTIYLYGSLWPPSSVGVRVVRHVLRDDGHFDEYGHEALQPG